MMIWRRRCRIERRQFGTWGGGATPMAQVASLAEVRVTPIVGLASDDDTDLMFSAPLEEGITTPSAFGADVLGVAQ